MIISPIQEAFIVAKNIQLDLLRLDMVHPQISGNKWFKLKYNIEFAISNQFESVLSFGGAYSNHLHALAFAGKKFGINSIGIIRGEEVSNPTLEDCKKWGMQLKFISRSEYKQKSESDFIRDLQKKFPSSFIIPEGGGNALGVKGCQEILDEIDSSIYDSIAVSVGTNTTLEGIVSKLLPHQHAMGFIPMKGVEQMKNDLSKKITPKNLTLISDYHFGGFGKYNQEVLDFIVEFKENYQIELDLVYTSKMMFGIFDLIKSDYYKKGTRILAIHTGGVQGNRSLKEHLF